MQRVHEGGKLARSKVSGQKSHPLAGGAGCLEVFHAVVDDDLRDIFSAVLGRSAKFGELAPQMPKQGANDAATFAARHFRKSDLEIAHAHAAKPAVQQVNQQSQGHGCRPRHRPGQSAQGAHDRPHQGIFQPMAHGLHVIGLAKYQCGSIAGLGFSGGSLWVCGGWGEAGC